MTESVRRETFEEFAEVARHAAVLWGKSITEPEGDWMPQMLLQDATGANTTVVIPGDQMNHPECKALLGRVVLPGLVRQARAVRLAIIVSAWISMAEIGSEREEAIESGAVQPGNDPLAKEFVLVVSAEAGRIALWAAPVQRDLDDPPTLGDWLLSADDITGRLFRPAIDALEPMVGAG